MTDLRNQRRMASNILKCGANRVWMDNDRIDEIVGNFFNATSWGVTGFQAVHGYSQSKPFLISSGRFVQINLNFEVHYRTDIIY